jgi:glycosyltransferase involved in cell wall biosynthesis
MKILFITQHFPPEKGAVRRIFEFAQYFAKEGHDISIVTAIPNYPDGIVPPKYRGKFYDYEEIENLKIHRNWVLPASNNQPKKRMLGFLTFLFSTLVNSRKLKGDYDLLIASSPPITTPLIGYVMSKIKKCRFVLEVRDLQPQSSEDFGNLNPSLFTRMLKRYMDYIYSKADQIVGVTEGISDYLKNSVIDKSKVFTIKSGVGQEFINSEANGIRKRFGWDEKFLVMYAGTLGWAHSLEIFIESARQLTDKSDIKFVFVGDGQKREVLESMVCDYGLKNVDFVGIQPLDSIPDFLQASDVLVHNMKDVPIAKGNLPSKLFEYMASSKPILYGSSGGEAVDELEKAGGALIFRTEDSDRLSKLILDLRDGTIVGSALGEKYHKYVVNNHCREKWAGEYLKNLKDPHYQERLISQPDNQNLENQEPDNQNPGNQEVALQESIDH